MGSDLDALPARASARSLSLPFEIVARCFLFLPEPLLARLAVLHVSRTWRAAAFAFPETWALLRISEGEAHGGHLLVDLVLSKTSSAYPVDFLYERAQGLVRHGLQEDMGLVVEKHLPRFRSITWTAVPAHALTLCSEAPRLESLSGRMIFPIPELLLGGTPSKLRSLELNSLQLPRNCPALATVRHLKSCIPATASHAEFLYLLFELCPALESLDLRIVLQDATLLPRGPGPRALRRLRLDTVDEGVKFMEDFNRLDLITLCESWHIVSRLQSLELSTHMLTVTDAYFSFILDGADSVAALSILGSTYTHITARHADGAEWKLCLRHRLPFEAVAMARFLAPRLTTLRDLTLTSDILQLLAGEACALPCLTALCVIVYPVGQTFGRRAGTFPWRHLDSFPPMLQLERLDIDIRERAERGGCSRQPDEHDARALLAQLDAGLSSGSEQRVQITIRGFLPDVVTTVDVPAADAYTISFG